MKSALFTPKAVIFDMDGTLTEPYIDFAAIKQEIGAADSTILEFLASVADEEERRRLRAIVDRYEREAAEASTLNRGVRKVLRELKARKIPIAILTRNTRESVDTVSRKHRLHFDVVVTADDDLPPKPSGEPVKHIARRLGVEPGEVMMVGDFRFDVECGRAAGARTVFLKNRHFPDDPGADYTITELIELLDILGEGPTDRTETGE